MLTLPNWIHKILKGYGYYSILSNLINEGLRASSSTNTPKSWSIKIKLHCLKTCTSSVLKVQRKVEGDSSSGEILGRLSRPRVWASSAPSSVTAGRGASLPAGNGLSPGVYYWPRISSFKKNSAGKSATQPPSLCFLRPQGLGGQVTELFVTHLHNESQFTEMCFGGH